MKKFTLFLMSLLLTVGAMAESVTYTITPSDGSFNKTGWAATWTSSSLDVATTFSVPVNNFNASNTTNFECWVGKNSPSTWTLSVDSEYKIVSYSFDFVATDGTNFITITAGDKTMTSTADTQNWAIEGVDASYTTFQLSGANKGVTLSNFTITVEPSNVVIVDTPDEFENGKIYTFVTSRGWMGAMESNDNVISTAYTSNNVTGSAEDEYFQWTVYKSENENYYLYNIGKGMFLGIQTANNTAIPFVAEPASDKLTFKQSSSTTYPIMFSTDNAGVVNHSTAHDPGLINWTGGWDNLSDDGSNHVVTEVGEVESSILEAIVAAVAAFEADNTAAVAELDEAIATATAMQAYIGTGLGKYSYTGEGNYEELFAAIVAFRNAITATNDPSPAEVEAKTAELNAIIASFTLNMPEAGKYYRLKGNSGNYITATTLYDASSGQMAMTSDNGEGTIFYLDSESHLLSYATGTYVKQTREIGSVGDTKGVWAITASPRNNGTYALQCTNTSNAGQYLHDNDGTRADRCSSNCGTAHDFTIEEVTTLPVTVTEAGYATFFAPVEVTVPEGTVTAHTVTVDGEWASLSEALTTIPANTGVVLANAGTVELTINYEGTAAAIEGNVLAGTAAKSIISIENGSYYVLAKPEGAEVAGLYTPKNGDDKTTFINGSHKAYMHLAAQGAAYYSFRFPGTTGVEKVEIGNEKSEIYDLTGRRVEAITAPGIYIVNGVKRVVR